MKLGDIYKGFPAWERLSLLPKTPQSAYLLMKYFRTVREEFQLISEHYDALVKEIGREHPRGSGRYTVDSEKGLETFGARFNAYLRTDSALPPADMTLEQLVKAISQSKAGVIAEADLLLLEPFFLPDQAKARGKAGRK